MWAFLPLLDAVAVNDKLWFIPNHCVSIIIAFVTVIVTIITATWYYWSNVLLCLITFCVLLSLLHGHYLVYYYLPYNYGSYFGASLLLLPSLKLVNAAYFDHIIVVWWYITIAIACASIIVFHHCNWTDLFTTRNLIIIVTIIIVINLIITSFSTCTIIIVCVN